MKSLFRYLAGYVLDFFRERVTAEDFRGEQVRRVLLTSGFEPRGQQTVRRMFPQAALYAFPRPPGLRRIRSARFDASCIAMAGGGAWERLAAVLSGSRHKLLIPSPDYVYRLGMRRGGAALTWAVTDRFLLAPLALAWLGLLACWLCASGLVKRAARAEAQGG
jgi:hypothetical protein